MGLSKTAYRGESATSYRNAFLYTNIPYPNQERCVKPKNGLAAIFFLMSGIFNYSIHHKPLDIETPRSYTKHINDKQHIIQH